MSVFDAPPPRQPTPEECSENAYVAELDLYACWYPQMGGYVGRCWIRFDDNADDDHGSCFDALVYHDGEFPFRDDKAPVRTHHCMWRQFVDFGNQVGKFNKRRADDLRGRMVNVSPKRLETT